MLPVLPLKAVCLPNECLTVEITEERYKKLVERCYKHSGELAVVFCSDYENEVQSMKNVGCEARITHYELCDNGCILIEIQGVCKFSYEYLESKLDVYYASGVEDEEDVIDIAGTDNLFLQVFEAYQNYLTALNAFDSEMMPESTLDVIGYNDTYKLISDISMPWEKKQQGLEINSTKKRLEFILSCLQFERDMLSFMKEESGKEQGNIMPAYSLN